MNAEEPCAKRADWVDTGLAGTRQRGEFPGQECGTVVVRKQPTLAATLRIGRASAKSQFS